jgi:hypothetical protein
MNAERTIRWLEVRVKDVQQDFAGPKVIFALDQHQFQIDARCGIEPVAMR